MHVLGIIETKGGGVAMSGASFFLKINESQAVIPNIALWLFTFYCLSRQLYRKLSVPVFAGRYCRISANAGEKAPVLLLAASYLFFRLISGKLLVFLLFTTASIYSIGKRLDREGENRDVLLKTALCSLSLLPVMIF